MLRRGSGRIALNYQQGLSVQWKIVTVWRNPDVPGLMIHQRRISEKQTHHVITHEPSGLEVLSFASRADAERALGELAGLADWQNSWERLRENPALRHQVDAVGRNYGTQTRAQVVIGTPAQVRALRKALTDGPPRQDTDPWD